RISAASFVLDVRSIYVHLQSVLASTERFSIISSRAQFPDCYRPDLLRSQQALIGKGLFPSLPRSRSASVFIRLLPYPHSSVLLTCQCP
ncbi:unnamed protein product, partial [Mycena citricolor]